MTYEEFDKILNNLPAEDYIVTIASKHQPDDEWEVHNEIIQFELKGYAGGPAYVWLNDWYEGQPYVEYIGICPLDCITTLKLEKDITHQELEKHFDTKEKILRAIYLEDIIHENPN